MWNSDLGHKTGGRPFSGSHPPTGSTVPGRSIGKFWALSFVTYSGIISHYLTSPSGTSVFALRGGTILSTARLSSALDCSDFRAFRLSRECRTDGNKKAPLIYDRRRIKRGRGIRGTQVEWGERASDQDFQRAQGTDKVRDYAQHTQHLEEVPYETSTCRMRVIEGPRTAHTVTSSIQYQFASASLPGNLISHFG